MDIRNTLAFLRLLRGEPYLFICMFTFGIKSAAVAQLFQDKICSVDMGLSHETCRHLQQGKQEDLQEVLKVTNNLRLLQAVISNAPCVLLLFFVGNWIDKYRNGVKLILLSAAAANVIESCLLIMNSLNFNWPPGLILLSFIPSSLTGNFPVPLMSIYSQATKETPPSMRPIRFAALEFCIFMGASAGAYFVGALLPTTPLGSKLQIHNYTAIFLSAAILEVAAFVWVLLIFRNKPEELLPRDNNDNEDGSASVSDMGEIEILESKKWWRPIVSLFDLHNVYKTCKTSFVKRPNHGRLKIWLLLISSSVTIANYTAPSIIMFQYTERILGWNSQKYNYINSLTTLLTTFYMFISVPIFVRILKIESTSLGIIGSVSLLAMSLIRGTLLTEMGFYLSCFAGALCGVTPIAIRAILAALVRIDELGRLFTVLTVAELLVNLLSSPIVTTIFNVSMHYYPGLVFQFSALTMFYPLLVFMVIDFMSTSKLTVDTRILA